MHKLCLGYISLSALIEVLEDLNNFRFRYFLVQPAHHFYKVIVRKFLFCLIGDAAFIEVKFGFNFAT
jgi:hypothetical protein